MQKITPAVHYKIEGVWMIDREPFGEPCILVIMIDGRTVQFPTSVTPPRINQTMRLWHSDYDGQQIRFRASPADEGWVRRVEPAEIGWVMTAERDGVYSNFHCTPLESRDLPEWYEERLAENLKVMADTELENQQDA